MKFKCHLLFSNPIQHHGNKFSARKRKKTTPPNKTYRWCHSWRYFSDVVLNVIFSIIPFFSFAVIGTSCIFPIDMVKTRLQASASKYSSPIDCFRKIIANEGGPRALYRGLSANLIGVAPEKSIKLVRNNLAKHKLHS